RDAIRQSVMAKLGLTSEQQKKIDALIAERDAALAALKTDSSLAPGARHEKARAIMSDFHGRMLAELTPEQQKKAAEMRSEAAEHMRQRGWTREDHQPRRQDMGPRAGMRNPLAIVAMGERIKDRIAEKLQLTDEQRDKLEHLGRAFRAQQREQMKKHLEEMRAVLTPEQQQKVDAWKQHLRRGHGGPPAPKQVGFEDEDGPGGAMVAGPDFNPDESPVEE
ncbi:MAG: hypothetical protein ACHQ5A_14670, partial [Opitutales bacterium]